MDVSTHIVSFYEPMLADLQVTRARDLLGCRSSEQVLVAGVKVATQTPPVRSGRRVVFLTLDDATGPVDATFFEDAQGPYATTLFHSWLLLVRGRVRRTGRRGISLRATGCWELGSMWQLWRESGAAAVHRILAQEPEPVPADSGRDPSDGGSRRRRVLVHASGFRMSPYADIKPAGQDVKNGAPPPGGRDRRAPAKLWHSSPGSSGW
jgi:error-prone DNA polymerase